DGRAQLGLGLGGRGPRGFERHLRRRPPAALHGVARARRRGVRSRALHMARAGGHPARADLPLAGARRRGPGTRSVQRGAARGSRSGRAPVTRYFVGITGASGHPYAEALIRALVEVGAEVDVSVTEAGCKVLRHELGVDAGERGEKLAEALPRW